MTSIGIWSKDYRKLQFKKQSAINAGYSEKIANEQGARLLTKVSIKSYIRSLQDEIKNENLSFLERLLTVLYRVF